MNTQLLGKAIVFLLAAVGIHCLLYLGFMAWVERHSQLFKDERAIMQSDRAYDYLFLGNSHVARGIDTSLIGGAFNYGFYGENIGRSYYKLESLLRHSPKGRFKYVVMPAEMGVHTAFMYRFNKYNYYYNRLIDEREWLSISRDYAYQANYWLDCVFVYSHFKEVLTTRDKKKEKGYMAIDQRSDAENAKSGYIEARTLIEDNRIETIYDPVLMEYVKKAIELCRQNDIKVIFVKYPLSGYFLSAARQIVGDTSLEGSPLEQVIDANGIITLDYESVFASCGEYFLDSHHLNRAGGEALSILVAHDLAILRKSGQL